MAIVYSGVAISIHALLAESDAAGNKAGAESFKFLSTLSLRRATCVRRLPAGPAAISIHALLAESDRLRRPVHQERLISIHALLAESDGLRRRVENVHKTFLSTLSLRRATIEICHCDLLT